MIHSVLLSPISSNLGQVLSWSSSIWRLLFDTSQYVLLTKHLLGYKWLDQFYYEIMLNFGLCSAPYIFNLFAEVLHCILQCHIPACICHYLDDFLQIFYLSSPPYYAQQALDWALALSSQLGLHFQPSKVEGPATTLKFLGIELNSIAMEACLPCDKIIYLHDLLLKWSRKKLCTLRELPEFMGFLQFTSQVIPTSHVFLQALFNFSSTFSSLHS